MKTLRIPARFISIIVLALACGASSRGGILEELRGPKEAPAPAKPVYQRVAFVGSAEVKEVTGAAERLVGINRWEPLAKNAKLPPGTLIRTHQGEVMLRMNESLSFIKVTPHTIVRLAEFEQGWDRGILSGKEEQTGFVVRSCRGKAFYRNGTEAWRRIQVNAVLPDGTDIRVENGAIVDMFHTRENRPVRVAGLVEVSLTRSLLPGTSALPTLASTATR